MREIASVCVCERRTSVRIDGGWGSYAHTRAPQVAYVRTYRLRKREVMGPLPLGGTEQSQAPPLTPVGSCSSIFIRMAPPKLFDVEDMMYIGRVRAMSRTNY